MFSLRRHIVTVMWITLLTVASVIGTLVVPLELDGWVYFAALVAIAVATWNLIEQVSKAYLDGLDEGVTEMYDLLIRHRLDPTTPPDFDRVPYGASNPDDWS